LAGFGKFACRRRQHEASVIGNETEKDGGRRGVYYWLHEEGVAVKFDYLAHHHVLLYIKLGDKLLFDI
jgi:SPX domain protein involved in polyphosphate accumulation